MKKGLALLLALVLVLGMSAFAIAEDTYEIALVTDVGNIDDESFNQGSWEGVVKFATENNISYNYYRPTEDSTDARVESISEAVAKGAKVIVCPGFLFEDAVGIAQSTFPEVNFLLLDTAPAGEAGANTLSILYKEEEAGYYAGYAAVKEGYTKLGFLGGMDVPAVVRFGFGFVQGVDAAAAELGLADVSVKYWYGDSFGPTDDIRAKMSSWYTDGTEIVFCCGGGIYLSALAAADEAGGMIIGVDSDQAHVSPLVLTSAMKDLTNSVVLALEEMYANDGKWPADKAGATIVLGTADNCVGLPTVDTSWRFKNYTVAEYEELFAKVMAGEVAISDSIDEVPAVTTIAVDYQE